MYDKTVMDLREISGNRAIPIHMAETAKEAADAIEQLSNAGSAYGRGWTLGYDAGRKESKPHWIPVTERLPPAKKEIYVTDGEYIARANLLDEVFPGDKPCWSYSGLGEITHWCERIPLPQQPKEEH